MSIMKKAVYKQTGGTVPFLPGITTQNALQNRLNTGQPFTNITGDYNTDVDNLLTFAADPRNVPQYYTGNTVATFDPLQEQAHRRAVDVAGQRDAITDSLLGKYDELADPNSAFNRQIAQASGAASDVSGASAGVLGGLRQQQAREAASQQAVRDNIQRNLSNLRSTAGDLGAGANILSNIGQERQQRAQDVINEDIKRFNWAQLTPQQQQDRLLSILTAKAGLNESEARAASLNLPQFLQGLGGLPGPAGSFFDDVLGFDPNGGGIFSLLGGGNNRSSGGGLGGIFGNILGSFFNEGGKVEYKNIGGIPGEIADQNTPLEAPQGPLSDPMMQPGMSRSPEMGMMPGEAPMDSDMNTLESPDMIGEFDLEPMSELDKIEDSVEQLIATTGLPLTVTRKIIKGKTKKKGS